MCVAKGTGQTEPLNPDDKVPCVVCREPVFRGAKVCNQCNRAQDWTRYLLRWGTIAGAIVAVLSLLSAAHSLREFIATPANLGVLSKACTTESLELAVTNLGDKPAMLTRVTLRLKLDGVIADKRMPLHSVQGEEIIAPHDTQKIVYARMVAGTPASLSDAATGTAACAYVVDVDTTDFEGNEKSFAVECACPAM